MKILKWVLIAAVVFTGLVAYGLYTQGASVQFIIEEISILLLPVTGALALVYFAIIGWRRLKVGMAADRR